MNQLGLNADENPFFKFIELNKYSRKNLAHNLVITLHINLLQLESLFQPDFVPDWFTIWTYQPTALFSCFKDMYW